MMRQRFFGAVPLVLLAIAMSACAPPLSHGIDHSDLDRTPRPVGTPAPDNAGADLLLPPSLHDARVFDPGWDTRPQQSQGIYLAPRVEEDRVVFTAVSEDGTVLWTAERPMLCSAFVVTAGDDGALAILMDITPGDSTLSETTVSAYDLRTGVKRWGPVDVPGPHLGPGLVFAAPPPEAMGGSGPRLVIDPATGEPLANESSEPGTIVLGEQDGTVLLADDTQHIARTAEKAELWRLPLVDLEYSPDDLRTASDIDTHPGVVLLGGPTTGAALVDLTGGTLLGTGVRGIALDRSTNIRVVLDDKLHALDTNGLTLWSRDVPADATLLSAGDGVVYIRSTGQIDVLDSASGNVSSVLPSDAEVPRYITETGAGIVDPYEKPLLVTPTTAPR